MKRVLTVLILVMSGSLFIAVSQMPGDAFAADPTEQYLETDTKDDDIVVDLFGRTGGEDANGDPDAYGDGLEDVKISEGAESPISYNGIDGTILGDLWIFVATTISMIP